MQSQTDKIRIGTFQITDKSIIGHVTLNGEKTTARLSSNEFYSFSKKEEARIHGVLTDHEKMTLIQCVTTTIPGQTTTPNGQSFHASVFPHYVVTGNRHVEPDEKNIRAVEVTLENAHILFWDFGAFGLSLFNCDANNAFSEKLTAKGKKRPKLGAHAHLFYFTGKSKILSSKTIFGRISAAHCPVFTSPSPSGIKVKNRIPIRVEFETPLAFQEAINRVYALIVFAEILMGREQHIERLTIELTTKSKNKDHLDVYQSMAPHSTGGEESERTQPGDVLINGGIAPRAFSDVLASWLSRQPEWKNARFRFIQSFREENVYTADRLVAAANLFDLLPQDSVGQPPIISTEFTKAASEAKKLFKALPHDQERDSILGALGRIGKHNLRSKVGHRARLITDKIGTKFKEWDTVIAAAIAARNYFVHGSPGNLTPQLCDEFSVFFTDTLEFIFAASDLVEAGWDIEKWVSRGTTMSHPLGRYRVNYEANLNDLKKKSGTSTCASPNNSDTRRA